MKKRRVGKNTKVNLSSSENCGEWVAFSRTPRHFPGSQFICRSSRIKPVKANKKSNKRTKF